ncbi:hypothetical protein DNTS_009869 [Danionella cerebrum]|uniref:Sema domain-containing protein n=1 Tax=Danionella cerebrum TaxID=2873325 RepID=A0A553NJJ6_9TELE|nr:hypothetical protein DNTS_009869 [Danionella translucida]
MDFNSKHVIDRTCFFIIMATMSLAWLLPLISAVTPFPKDLQPISVVELDDSLPYPSFQGLESSNDTEQQLGLNFQRLMRIQHMLYIAARDHVFVVNLTAAVNEIIPQQVLTWRSTDVSKCTVRGRNRDECYNYIKVLVRRNDETLFACGTNALNPACRNYRVSSLEQVGQELLGQARCPFESRQSNVGVFAGGHFYSATVTDFQESDSVIYRSLGGEGRPVLRTVKYDSKWLREPHFIHAVEYGVYVYFFFSELAVEHTGSGKNTDARVPKHLPLNPQSRGLSCCVFLSGFYGCLKVCLLQVVYSRVARVCKNDSGGSTRVLDRHWTSFLKARLDCSVPGETFFYFDKLQALTGVLQINHRPSLVGVFTTQTNSIPGSAVCGFYLDDIERVFTGRFKEQKNSDSVWTAVPEELVPKPRPGSCAGEASASSFSSSVQFPDSVLSFIKTHPLMDESVPSVNNRPFITSTSSRYKLTQIAVDISAGPHRNRTIMFLGSEDGHVLKVLTSTNANSTHRLLEDIDVFNPTRCRGDRGVLALELDTERHALFVAFSSCVIRVPLSRCAQHSACRRSCLDTHDPYCLWLRTGRCADVAPGFKAGFEQDIDGDHSHVMDLCSDVLSETESDAESAVDAASGVQQLPEEESQSEGFHYTLLGACVLVAFVFGGIFSGLMVSCYCSQRSQQTEESEAPLSHTLSLTDLAKLNLLLDSKPDTRDAPAIAPQIYCQPTAIQAQRPAEEELVSSLPTPDSTPELPIKNLKVLNSQWERSHVFNSSHQLFPSSKAKSSESCDVSPEAREATSSGPGLYVQTPKSRYSCFEDTPDRSALQTLQQQPLGGSTQRPVLIKMGSGITTSRQHTFKPKITTTGNVYENHRPLITRGSCLTRQHSYSESSFMQRAALVRRTASLKPQIPPKPMNVPYRALVMHPNCVNTPPRVLQVHQSSVSTPPRTLQMHPNFMNMPPRAPQGYKHSYTDLEREELRQRSESQLTHSLLLLLLLKRFSLVTPTAEANPASEHEQRCAQKAEVLRHRPQQHLTVEEEEEKKRDSSTDSPGPEKQPHSSMPSLLQLMEHNLLRVQRRLNISVLTDCSTAGEKLVVTVLPQKSLL